VYKETQENFIRCFGTILASGAILTISVMLFCKLGGKMFDIVPRVDLNTSSIAICKQAHGGTPVLEENGDAYKSCAINGKSDTRNVVK
jgi:hypothetical protein